MISLPSNYQLGDKVKYEGNDYIVTSVRFSNPFTTYDIARTHDVDKLETVRDLTASELTITPYQPRPREWTLLAANAPRISGFNLLAGEIVPNGTTIRVREVPHDA
jgi:hypothetical protein